MRLLCMDDRQFLARISALNTVLGKMAFPVIEGAITAEQQRKLGTELMAIGEEFPQRADCWGESELTTVDGNGAVSSTQSSRHSMNNSSVSSLLQTSEQARHLPSSWARGAGGEPATTGVTIEAPSHSATRSPPISSSHSELILDHT